MSDQKRRRAEVDLLNGSIWKALLRYFFPLLAGTFFQLLYTTVDALVVGRFVGKEALAAVGGSTGSLINLFVGLFVGLSSGATVIVSQFYGAKKQEDLSRAVHTGIAMAIGSGLILTVLIGATAPLILRLMHTPEEILPNAQIYLWIFAAGMVGNMLYNVASSILRAVGDSRRPFYILVVCSVLNIGLDLLLVAVIPWGVGGAALATILSQLVSAVLTMLCLMRTTEPYRVELRRIRIDREMLSQILRIGVPSALQSLMYSFSNVLIQSNINSFGTDTVAAWTVWGRIDALFWMVISSLGLSIATFVGQNYGALQFDRVRRGTRQGLVLTALFTAAMSSLFYFGAEPLVRIFTGDDAVVHIAVQMAHFMSLAFLTYIFLEVLSSSLRGMGDVLIPTVITVVGVCFIRVGWIYGVVPHFKTIQMVMCSYPFAWIITGSCYIVYYLYYVRKHKIR